MGGDGSRAATHASTSATATMGQWYLAANAATGASAVPSHDDPPPVSAAFLVLGTPESRQNKAS